MMRAILVAAMLGSISPNVDAEELGRLFFTPQERDSLDRQRRGERSAISAAPALNGYIKRSDGRNTIWVDGGPLRANDKQVSQAVVDGDPGVASGIRIKRSAEQESMRRLDPRTQPSSDAKVPRPAKKPQSGKAP